MYIREGHRCGYKKSLDIPRLFCYHISSVGGTFMTLKKLKDIQYRNICGSVGGPKYVVMRRIKPQDETHGLTPRAKMVTFFESPGEALGFAENDFYAWNKGKGYKVLCPPARMGC